jgi:hypothetical protein
MSYIDARASQREDRITRAFLKGLSLDASQLPHHLSHTKANGVAARMEASGLPAEARCTVTIAELSSELYDLLCKYVNLMDGLGAESLEDEEAIGKVVSILVRAGWTISLPHAGELGGQPNAKSIAAEMAKSNVHSGESYTGSQWGSNSVPENAGHGQSRT